ncbi:MAG: pyruvate, phosphate dikinase, partial [Paracoccaceae bacterium]
ANNQGTLYLTRDDRGGSLEEDCPEIFQTLRDQAELMRRRLREEMQIEFTIEDGTLHILDGVKVAREPRAAVRIAVSLAQNDIISKEEALMRIDPMTLGGLLHRQVSPNAARDIIG